MVTTTAQHAFRALTVLESLPQGVWALTRELARVTGSPPKYLTNVMVALAHAGIVEAKRGIGGGYRLARPPQSVSLREVLAVLDGSSTLGACLLAGFRACTDEDGCPAHTQFKAIRDAWLAFLTQTTLDAIACRDEGKGGDCLSFWRADQDAAAQASAAQETRQR